MKDLCPLLLIVGAGYLAYRWHRNRTVQQNALKAVKPSPPGTVATGRTQRTTTGARPGEEVRGYRIADWVEVILPTGERDWVEVKVEQV